MKLLKLTTLKKGTDGRPDVVAIPFHAVRDVRYVYGGQNCDACFVNGEMFRESYNEIIEKLEEKVTEE